MTPTAHGLTVSAPTHTLAGDVKRLNIQEPVKTLLKTVFPHPENISFSVIMGTKRFPFSAI